MTAPDRIAVYWTAVDEDTMPARLMAQTPRSPIFDEDLPKSQRIEYVRADLVDPAAIREAALREAAAIAVRHLSRAQINELLWHEGRDWAAQRISEAILALIPKGAADDRA